MSEPMPTKAQAELMARLPVSQKEAPQLWAVALVRLGKWVAIGRHRARLTASGRAALARYREEVGDVR